MQRIHTGTSLRCFWFGLEGCQCHFLQSKLVNSVCAVTGGVIVLIPEVTLLNLGDTRVEEF